MTVMDRAGLTDKRLDELNARVEKGFEGVKGEVHGVKGEVAVLRSETKAEFRELRADMGSRFKAIEARLNLIDARFDSLQRTMVLGVVTMSASIVGALLVA